MESQHVFCPFDENIAVADVHDKLCFTLNLMLGYKVISVGHAS